MVNTAEIIKLIIRDESVHGTYIGSKFRIDYNQLSEQEQESIKNWIYELAYDLYMNELEYTKELYAELGWVDDVITFLEYNLNKALDNLGLPPLFPTTASDVNPLVMNGISTTTSNHDFFSQVGNGYLLGNVEPLSDNDFDIVNDLIA